MKATEIVFVASIALVLYVLAGYPILLCIYASFFPKPIRKEPLNKSVSIIIPVRNGSRWIDEKLRSLLASNYPVDLIEILVVSDGSTDQTNQIVSNYRDARVQLLAVPSGGKATAISRGLQHVSREIVVFTDVRQIFDPDALAKLVSCFADPSVGAVTGELVIREGTSPEEYNTGLYWRYEKWIRRNLNRIDAMLGATGSIYAMRRELIAPVPSEILLDDVYLPFQAAFRGFRIYMEERAKAYDMPTMLSSEFWRKVRTQAGVYQILIRFPGLLWPGNRRFVHFISHKVGRLLLPFAMLAIAIASFGLPSLERNTALILQAIFYGLALLDPVVPPKLPLKRLTAVIRAFVVLTAAALCALAVFFRPAHELWKETRVASRQS